MKSILKEWKYEATNEEKIEVFGTLRAKSKKIANENLVKWGYTNIVFIV